MSQLNRIDSDDGIDRFWDSERGVVVAQLLPGEFYVTVSEEIVSTVLGSCISVCMHEPVLRFGGMNHFLLPEGEAETNTTNLSVSTRYGVHAMEMLINAMLSRGADKSILETKIFGGGSMLAIQRGVGERNIKFVREFLKTEGFIICGEDVGQDFSRKIRYNPMTGKVMVKKLRSLHANHIKETEKSYIDALVAKTMDTTSDLF